MIVTDGEVVSDGPLTFSVAVPVAVPLVPVTVCGPAADAVQIAPVQLPPSIVNVVVAVLSPRLLPEASKPWAV